MARWNKENQQLQSERDAEVLRLREAGYSRDEIGERLDLTFYQVKKALARARGVTPHSNREGIEERVPRYTFDGDYYTVQVAGRDNIRIHQDALRQFIELYALHKLTINQICWRLNIPRRDFWPIKTAFGITKDSIPFIDEDVMERETDELVEETIEKKKEKYFIDLQNQEITALKKEIAQYRKTDYTLDRIHEMVFENIHLIDKEYPVPEPIYAPPSAEQLMLELPIFDMHLGKLAWKPETGDNYDYKIARSRFLGLIEKIVHRVKLRGYSFEKVLLPIGSDYFNFDTIEGTTTGGTSQDNDLRWLKLYTVGVDMLVNAINTLSAIAPVEAVYVPGNHDKMTSYYAIMYLSAWFREDGKTKINTDPKTRKYVEYGNNLIGYTHGNKEKGRLFGNMQVEAPEAWGRTKYREFHCGHFHSEQVKELNGVKVRYLPCLTGKDAFHFEHGYHSQAQHVSFVWNKKYGLSDTMIFPVELI